MQGRLRISDVNTFESTGCKVIGLKFSGLPGSSFLCATTITPERHIFSFHAIYIIFTRCDYNIGHFLNAIILMALFGHGETDDFIFMIILLISTYDGVSKLKFIVGFFSFFIHDGGLKVL